MILFSKNILQVCNKKANIARYMSSSAVDKFFPSPITLLTEDERMIKESVRKWASKDLKPRVQEMETNESIHPSLIQKLFENGYMSMEINEKYGGIGANFTSACFAIQEISRIDPSVALMVDVHNTLVINMIRFWGSDYLKEKYLPKLAKDSVSSFCLSEANAGSDAFSMKTQAYRSSDDSFTINGTKSWITNAKEAEDHKSIVVLACNLYLARALSDKNRKSESLSFGAFELICDSNSEITSICTQPEILQNSYARIFTATGIILIVNVVRSLQGIFLPFALFGSGLYNIFKTLTPFLIVSLLILVAFTNAYRISVNFANDNKTWDPETTRGQCVESFLSCFLTVLQGFFGGGGDATTGWLDIAFGIVIAIILLNVVIAIVSDSWEDSKGTAAYAFWSSRVERLCQLGKSAAISKHNLFLFTWIDSLRWIPFQDDISWSKDYPYSLVQSREEYENPYYYFSKRDARKIANSRSLDSSLYWIRKDTDLGLVESEISQAYTSFKWLMNNTVYNFFVLLGIPIAGLLWPAEFSEYVLNIGLDTNKSTSSNNDYDGNS